jgi:hypothetical protein
MSLLKLALYSVGGAAVASGAAAFGGVGLVAGGAAIGLSALEVAIVGGGVGSTVYKIRHDEAKARQQVATAKAAEAAARKKQADLNDKIAKARQVLNNLEDTTPATTKGSRFVSTNTGSNRV